MKLANPLVPILIFSAAVTVQGDDLVLKDGRTVKWKAVRSVGHEYEIETESGANMTVLKADVARFVPTSADMPLVGAAFTFDPKKIKLESVNLFKKLDPRKDSLVGGWSVQDGALMGSMNVDYRGGEASMLTHARIEAPSYVPSEEYDLSVVAECVANENPNFRNFVVGLCGGGSQFAVSVDQNGKTSVIGGHSPGQEALGSVFGKGVVVNMTFMVRREGLVMRVNERDYMTWKGDWDKLSVPEIYRVRAKNILFLGVTCGSFKVTKWTVTAPKGEKK